MTDQDFKGMSPSSPRGGGLTGLEVIVDDGRPDVIEVLERVDDLHDDGPSLLL